MRIPVLCLLACLVPGVGHAAVLRSDFKDGTQGWSVGNAEIPGETRSGPTLTSLGIQTADTYETTAFFAPGAFLGNKADFYGGTFSFDLADRAGNDHQNLPALILYGAGQVISIDGAPPSDTGLTHFSFNLREAGFRDYYDHSAVQSVSRADFRDVLANLTDIAIGADWHTGADDTLLANVSMTTLTTVPLPGSAVLFAGALLLLAGVPLRKSRRSAVPAGRPSEAI